MSRLDDELKNAFRRVPPPADFTARLLERIAQQPAPRPRWWQRLAVLFEPPKLRWVAIGVTASLLLAVGALQISKMRQPAVSTTPETAMVQKASETTDNAAAKPGTDHPDQNAANVGSDSPQRIKPAAAPHSKHRVSVARVQREEELRIEGEAAKEKLMLALSIASSALSEAQKAVHDDGLNP